MGSFSWLFADTNNTKNLRADRKGYVACPDGTFICEPCYETMVSLTARTFTTWS